MTFKEKTQLADMLGHIIDKVSVCHLCEGTSWLDEETNEPCYMCTSGSEINNVTSILGFVTVAEMQAMKKELQEK